MKLNSYRVQFILDYGVAEGNRATMLAVLRKAMSGGVRMVQIRAKGVATDELVPMVGDAAEIVHKYDGILIVNDYWNIAVANADGVHIGKSDGNAKTVRESVKGLMGVSVDSPEAALDAENAGADYLGYGAIFPTTTKSDAVLRPLSLAEQIKASVSVPVYLIGGINLDNVEMLIDKGFTHIAVCSAIQSAKNPEKAASVLVEKMARVQI